MDKETKQKYLDANRDKLAEELSLAKIDMIQTPSVRFLTASVFRREPTFTADLPVETAGADGKNIVIDPIFWHKINRKQKMRVLFHEGFHNLLGHMDRRTNSKADAQAWNIAADSSVESIANECGIVEGNYMPGVINPTAQGTVNLKINGKGLIISRCHEKSVEEIYGVIMQHVKQNPPGPGQGDSWQLSDGKNIVPIDGHNLKEASVEERAERESALRQALVEHKLKGTMPGGLADMIEEMLKGKVDWRAELREAILPEVKAYQAYRRPSKRGIASGMILPSMVKEGVDVVMSIDTSGSIGKTELAYYTGEIKNMFDQFDPGTVKATLLLHHSHVYDTLKLEDVEDLKKIQTKSGGTSHEDVFEKAEELKAQVLVCLTDGYSDFPETTNIRKVLWIVTEENGLDRIPDTLGKKILVDIKDFGDN